MATNINQTLEDLIAAISGLAGQSEACCEVGGQQIDDPPSDGTVVYGEGEDYPDAESYFDAKCSSSNGIYDTVAGMVDWLRDNNVDLKAGVLGSITTAIILGLALSGPVGWAIQLSGVVITVLAGFIIKSVVDFIDMLDGLDDVHEELVLAMYNAADTNTARENFLTIFAGATPNPSSIELTLTRFLLPSSVLNQLFVPRADVGSYESPDPVDCGAAILAAWSFPSDYQSWTFVDLSDPGSSATRSYDAVEEAIENELIVASLPYERAEGENTSPAIAIAVTPGASVQADYGPTSDGTLQGVDLIAEYSDATEESASVSTATVGTLILTLTQSKTINAIVVKFARQTSGTSKGSTHDTDLLEVRIFGAA